MTNETCALSNSVLHALQVACRLHACTTLYIVNCSAHRNVHCHSSLIPIATQNLGYFLLNRCFVLQNFRIAKNSGIIFSAY